MAQEVTTLTLKEEHDQLLAAMPEDATHDAVDCPFCEEADSKIQTATEGGDMSKTYTEDELAAAVAEAVAPVADELATLKASREAQEVEARIAALKAELEAAKAEVETQLDVVTAERDAAKGEYENLVAYLDAEVARQAEADAFAAKRDERIARVKEVASFTDEYVSERADKWAALDDEAFESLVEAIEAAKEAKTDGSSENKIPASTAMTATRDESGSGPSVKDVRRDVMGLNLRGIDPRTL